MEQCAFDVLFTKSVPHILEKIFLSLDYDSFKKCINVSKVWNELLTSETFKRNAKYVFQEEIGNEQKKLFNDTCDGNTEGVRKLLSNWMLNVNNWISPAFGSTLLHMPAQNGHKDVVQLLLNAGVERDKTDCLGRTPLHLAAGFHHLEVVNVLLDAGADPNKEDNDGGTPLHHAVYSYSLVYGGYTEVIQTLIDRGADPRKKNNSGDTPIDTAHIYGSRNKNSRVCIITLLKKYVINK